MDFIELGCALLRTSYVESFMAVAGYFGHGLAGSILGLLLLAHGYVYNNQRTKRAGIAVLAALIVAGIAAQAGIPAARKLIAASHPLTYSLQRTAGWLGIAAFGIAGEKHPLPSWS